MYIVLGWIFDRIFGDPVSLPHPIVWFGKSISFFEKRFNCGTRRMIKGGAVAIALILGTFFLGKFLIDSAFGISYWLGIAIATVGVFYCLAGKTLANEVRMVFEAVDESVEKGRVQVGRIVGRDTANLSPQEIRAAALETLAENLSDGVVAPLFWCALLGVPGMLAYKMVNTLDSMIGYRNERYKDFGCIAAHIDDVANWLPARITAILLILVGGEKGKRISMLKFVFKYGPEHLSPNSGYPEAALAAILNCRFGGPHDYFGEEVYKPYIGENEKIFTKNDMELSVKVAFMAEVVAVLIAYFTWLLITF